MDRTANLFIIYPKAKEHLSAIPYKDSHLAQNIQYYNL
jgi:hypothetical protein